MGSGDPELGRNFFFFLFSLVFCATFLSYFFASRRLKNLSDCLVACTPTAGVLFHFHDELANCIMIFPDFFVENLYYEPDGRWV